MTRTHRRSGALEKVRHHGFHRPVQLFVSRREGLLERIVVEIFDLLYNKTYMGPKKTQ